MPVVLRRHGLRFVIYTDDHAPAHVHVYGDGEAKIEIGQDGQPPVVLWEEAMSRAVRRRALRAVLEHQAELLEKWAEYHG